MAEQPRPPVPGLSVPELEKQFRELTLLLYDTSVPIKTLEERVYSHLAPDIEFLDPLIRARGLGKFKVGLSGFHCVFPFEFEIFQLAVQLAERGDRGRAMVNGVMNLRTLPFYTYALRTILVYDFVLTDGGTDFQLSRLEEIWSLGDLFENVPVLGRLYGAARAVSGYFFTGFFWLGSALTGGVTVRPRYEPAPRYPERYSGVPGRPKPGL